MYYITGGETVSQFDYVKSESSIIIKEPVTDVEKSSQKEDVNESESFSGTYVL